jgi:hypothetical protein
VCRNLWNNDGEDGWCSHKEGRRTSLAMESSPPCHVGVCGIHSAASIRPSLVLLLSVLWLT